MRFRDDGAARRAHDDRGYVLVMTAVLLIPLMAFTAAAVDLGAWYARMAKMQTAADAAALAGVVWALDPTDRWLSVAENTAAANGFTSSATADVDVQRVGGTRIQVTITTFGQQYFGSMFAPTPQLRVSATAEYQRPLRMGSPENRLGTDPDLGYQPYYWLNVGSDTTTKGNGDRFTSRTCSTGAWACANSVNTEYSPGGHTFHVATDGTLSGANLDVQVFDPAFTYTGDLCDAVWIAAADMPAVQAMAATRYGESAATAATRYGRSASCPGDQTLGNGVAPNTTYIVRAPDLTPLDDFDNPAVCSITFDGRKPTSNTALRDLLVGSGSASATGREQVPFSSHYHRWFTICSVPPALVPSGGGDFIVQVKTTANLSGAPAPTTAATSGLYLAGLDQNINPSTGGYNRFSLRAGSGDAGTPSWGTGVQVFGPSRLPIYVNGVDVANGTAKAAIPSTTFATSFFATRVTHEYAGKVLQLSFWDIGDVSGSPAGVDFSLTSPDAAVSTQLLTVNGCSFKRDAVTIGAPTTYGASVSGCQISNLTAGTGDPSGNGYNGRLVAVTVPIPTNYTCAETDFVAGCWVKVSATYRGVPADTTTWAATILGGPVHLVS